MRRPGADSERAATPGERKMADGSGKLKGIREQMVAAAQALADERRSQTGSSPVPTASSVSVKTTKPVIDGSALRTDERQRLARERREEKERLNAAKEKELLEKEKKSKLQYEKQMEEKQKKLEEQKLKDEQKRIAAEEKRKQRLLEDKERREANVRRTLERSSQLDQRQKRWSWGGSGEGDKHGASGSSSPNQVDLIGKNASTAEPQPGDESGSGAANMRSTSTSNLKQTDGSIHKRLSSSSATLEKGIKQRSSSLSRLSNKTPLSPQPFSPKVTNQEQKGVAGHKRSSSLSRLSSKKSPPAHLEGKKKEEKSAHRPPSSPLDSSLISRLLAPTQSSLARSKSAATLSADGKELPDSHLCPRSASATSTSTPPSVSKGPMRSRSIDRGKTPSTAASGSTTSEASQKSGVEKPSPPSVGKRPPSPTVTSRRRSPSPAGVTKRAPSPTLDKRNSSTLTQRNRPPSPNLLKQRPPSPTTTQKPAPIQRPSLTPSVLSTTKKTAEPETKPKDKATDVISSEPKTEATSSKTKDDPSNKAASGSATAEEAAKMLAENRRLAREERERKEQERIQRQEEERIKQEEMAHKAEEDRIRLEEEEKLLEEKRKLEREEEQRLAQEDKIRRDQEEQERLTELQQQREEAEAKALEEAEKQRQEREKIMHQNMQERLQRKKRIEEIMKRTRKNDIKSEDKSEEDEDSGDIEESLQGWSGDNDDDMYENADRASELEEETASQESLSPKAALVESGELFINGNRPDIEEKLNGHSAETVPGLESSQVTDDTAVLSQDQLHHNEDDNTGESVPKLNGKSATWTFEEIIDLGIHSKTSNLSVDSIAMDGCNQDLIDAATIPPKLAFEEGQMNSLSATIETAAEM
ncbi:MAP7 domain-containing protein 3 isoform 2-T2 [Anomaloglossus baeobatrachus]|uniref:MAP7 domain-containing protein 3 isoform X2 n=1 Tax=Anomaloglossus baeobatrachus TaxID=238106 RepID=UPI003F4FDE7E